MLSQKIYSVRMYVSQENYQLILHYRQYIYFLIINVVLEYETTRSLVNLFHR